MIDKLDLTGIPNREVFGKDKYILASEQEKFTAYKLNICSPQYEWMPTSEWAGSNNTELNRCLGDIVGLTKDKKLGAAIDLKVQSFNSNKLDLFGSVTLNSYFGFGYNYTNHYYLCCNEYGKNIVLINANFVQDLIKKNIKFIYKSKFNRTKYDVNIYDWISKYYVNNPDFTTDFVAKEDFIPSRFIESYNMIKH